MGKNDIIIEGARLLYRNFSGKKSDYNREGDRNFCFIVDPETAKVLTDNGWNIKSRPSRDPQESDIYYMKVSVRFDKYPPEIWVVNGRGRIQIKDPNDLNALDWAEIISADLHINPSRWNNNGKSGLKAYLSKAFITTAEDRLHEKYKNVPVLDDSSPDFMDDSPEA